MAYLDKNGIPRVDEGTAIYDKYIDNAVDMLKSIYDSIELSSYLIRKDENYIANWEEIVEGLKHCNEVVNILISAVKNNYTI